VPPGDDVDFVEYVVKTKLEEDVGAVVVGYDKHFSYMKLMKAASYAERPGTLLIGTCDDHRAPYDVHDRVLPCTLNS
jgi:phosphoglycolate phosphatase